MKDLHEKWSHRWLSTKAESFHSAIDRLGLKAKEKIDKGEIILVYGGVTVPINQMTEYWKEMGHVGIQISNNFFIVPTNREELEKQGVVNHSCNPNAGFLSQIELMAIRDIEVGEEITFDYAFCESIMEDFECNCGAPNCRKIITKNDWKRADLKEKYGEYYSPYLRNK